MTEHLHPKRETYPLVNKGDELVIVSRDHLTTLNTIFVYTKALAVSEFVLIESRTLDDRPGVEVIDYSASGGGETLTITVDGANTVLTEGVDFNAVISNAETAIQIADAINTAAIGLVASTDVNQPYVYVVPDPSVGIKVYSLASSDDGVFTPLTLAQYGALQSLSTASEQLLSFPATGDPLRRVIFMKVFSGKISADIRSQGELRSYFRQPATLSGNTGHAGGWPTAPNPAAP